VAHSSPVWLEWGSAELELYMKRPNIDLIPAFANALGCACRGSTQ
jgi:hypothetical protein